MKAQALGIVVLAALAAGLLPGPLGPPVADGPLGSPRGPAVQAAPAATDGTELTRTADELRGLVDVDGRRLYLECAGRGAPTVVLEPAGFADGGASSPVWLPVWPAVAAFARVCVYDRANLGRSDPAPGLRTARDLVRDLHVLLRGAGLGGPVVLVGWSFGGLVVRLYAMEYPAEVAGLVLVDPSHEDQVERLGAVLPPGAPDVFGLVLPPESFPERLDVLASAAQVRAARAARGPRSLPAVPLVVLTRGRPLAELVADGPPLPPEYTADVLARLDAEWYALHDDLAGLAPGGRHLLAARSGHAIQQDQPRLVIEAVRSVAAARRAPPAPARPGRLPRTGTAAAPTPRPVPAKGAGI